MAGFPLRPYGSQPNLTDHVPLSFRGTFSSSFVRAGFLSTVPRPLEVPTPCVSAPPTDDSNDFKVPPPPGFHYPQSGSGFGTPRCMDSPASSPATSSQQPAPFQKAKKKPKPVLRTTLGDASSSTPGPTTLSQNPPGAPQLNTTTGLRNLSYAKATALKTTKDFKPRPAAKSCASPEISPVATRTRQGLSIREMLHQISSRPSRSKDSFPLPWETPATGNIVRPTSDGSSPNVPTATSPPSGDPCPATSASVDVGLLQFRDDAPVPASSPAVASPNGNLDTNLPAGTGPPPVAVVSVNASPLGGQPGDQPEISSARQPGSSEVALATGLPSSSHVASDSSSSDSDVPMSGNFVDDDFLISPVTADLFSDSQSPVNDHGPAPLVDHSLLSPQSRLLSLGDNTPQDSICSSPALSITCSEAISNYSSPSSSPASINQPPDGLDGHASPRDRHNSSSSSSRPNPNSPGSDGTPFPGSTSRIENFLHFVLPIENSIPCTESGCRSRFHNKDWPSLKQSLIRHLQVMHGFRGPVVVRWCSFCQCKIPVRVSSHSCFRDSPFFMVPASPVEYDFRCNKCSFTCSSRSGIRNHFRVHKREEALRNARSQDSASPPSPASEHFSPDSPSATSPSIPSQSQATAGTVSTPSVDDLGLSQDPRPDSPTGGPSGSVPEESGFLEASLDNLAGPDDPSPSLAFITRFKDLLSHPNTDLWSEFEDLLDEYLTFAKDFVKLPPPRDFSGFSQEPNCKDPKFIQRLYKRNRRRVIRYLTGDSNSAKCDLPHSDIASHFCPPAPVFSSPSVFDRPNPASDPPGNHLFTPEEVWARLRSAENTAPGPDRLTYQHWRGVDPGGRTLAAIFNICLRAGSVPTTWKETKPS